MRVDVLGVGFDNVTMDEAVGRAVKFLDGDQARDDAHGLIFEEGIVAALVHGGLIGACLLYTSHPQRH